MIELLLLQGIDVLRTRHRVMLGDVTYRSSTYFIPLNQPKRGVVKSLLERTLFPDDPWTPFQDGAPNQPCRCFLSRARQFAQRLACRRGTPLKPCTCGVR